MEKQKIEVHVDKNTKELVLREGQAKPVAELRKGIAIHGNIDVPRVHLTNPPKWLTEKMKGKTDNVLAFSHIKVDRENMNILYTEDSGNQWENKYLGKLSFTKIFEDFGINTGKSYSTLELAEFIKMNRSHFESKEAAMKLVSELRNFKAKVDKDVEVSADDRANRRVLVAQAVESNIPEKFNVTIPIFKGEDKQTFELEIAIEPVDFKCTLISPEANDYVEKVRDKIIDSEIKKIKDLHPNLRVFEV